MPGMSKGKVSFEMNLIEQLIINVETKVGIKINEPTVNRCLMNPNAFITVRIYVYYKTF